MLDRRPGAGVESLMLEGTQGAAWAGISSQPGPATPPSSVRGEADAEIA